MPYNVLLFPLIGGYYILANYLFFKYKYQRVSSQRLILNSALSGIFVCIFTFALRAIFENNFPEAFEKLAVILSGIIQVSWRYFWTMLFGLFITILTVDFLNWIFNKIPTIAEIPIIDAINKHGNELEQLCLDSITDGTAVQMTLKNEKVYIGFIDEAPIPSKTNYLTILPLYSGYRDADTKAMHLTTSYGPVIESLMKEDLVEKAINMIVVIKQDEILTMSPHDPEVFIRFHEGDNQTSPTSSR